ncbi:hypothetical protein CA267_014180 [Alteromonas pelagimontana]|uniref:Uncharacterized protein n=1 Tax=Alteromonas pelagimontana TaxID=1858656 RepID=A0A6M4MFF8_9ALTE|nr:hypothetical protein [Alteromonas pelagimontana]QJR81823.1 hypothetical protein CA267_014180 [Alteromonas pelagimontana]
MKLFELTHTETPDELNQINQQLVELLSADMEEMDRYQQLNSLIQSRDTFIRSYLPQLSEENKKLFAKKELAVNNSLKEMAQRLLKSAKDDISHFIRSQAATKKYK